MGQPLAHVLCSLPESGPHPGGGRGWAQAPSVEGGETLSEASLASQRHQSRMAPEGCLIPACLVGEQVACLGPVSAWGLEPRDPHCRSEGWNPGNPTPDLGAGTQGPPLQIWGPEPNDPHSRSGGWNPATPPLQIWS